MTREAPAPGNLRASRRPGDADGTASTDQRVSAGGATHGLVVLGVDPGTVRTGWGVVRRAGPSTVGIAAGTIRAKEREPLAERLKRIHDALAEVIAAYRPAELAVEDIFFARHARAALMLGHARGVVLFTGAEAGLAVASYPPAVVKRSIAGRGQADKRQLARVVGAILGWRDLSEPDAADALAVAITHARAAAARALIAPRAARSVRGRGRARWGRR